MKFLLFFLGIIFFFIFFFFSKNSFSWDSFFVNLYIEANIYVWISILLILGVIKTDLRKKHKKNTKTRLFTFQLSYKDVFVYIKLFFEKYIYYIACIFFYISLFLIFQVSIGEVDLPRIFLFFNILILILYFLEHKFFLFQDFIRVNTAIVSLYYILFHILYLFWYIEWFSWEDVLNILFLFLLFFFFFRSSIWKKYISALASYLITFIFLEISVFIKFFSFDMQIVIASISFFIALFFFTQTSYFSKKLGVSKGLVRVWGLLFSYIYLIFMSFQIFNQSFISWIFTLGWVYTWYILFLFHNKFQNYISLLFSSYAISLSLYSFYLLVIPESFEKIYLSFLLFCISWIFIFLDKIYKVAYVYDVYFFHIFSILVNLCWVLLFFFFWDFSILNLGILLLWESIYFFFSYYTLRKISKKWYTML